MSHVDSELYRLLATAERIDRLSDGLRRYDDLLDPPGTKPGCPSCFTLHCPEDCPENIEYEDGK